MKQLILVFLGGGLGSVLRYGISKLNQLHSIPFGTFLTNILGSLFIGFLLGLSLKSNFFASENQKLLLIAGFCGGFTTFSAFAYENYSFLKTGDYLNFLIYTLLSIIAGLASVFLGIWLSKI